MPLIRLLVVVCVLLGAAPAVSASVQGQPPPKPPPAQDEYVPIDQLPPEAEMPAAPMVIAAYTFVWVAFIAYMFTLLKRVKKVEADLVTLERERR